MKIVRSALFMAMIAARTLDAGPAAAAEIDGAALGLVWAAPFAGILLSISLLPLLAPHVWERHQGKIAGAWAALAILPMLLGKGWEPALGALAHTAMLDYIPFILLLLALFTTAGGIVIAGNIHGSPAANSLLLLVGAGLASVIGTTGASMVMIRPVMRANDNRKHNAHVIVFFIFLVSNIGGALTPLGAPPLFLGFLRGVDFFWTTTHLLGETLLIGGLALAAFYLIDRYFYRKEDELLARDPTPDKKIRVRGLFNILLIAVIIAAILFSASVDLGSAQAFGQTLPIAGLVRDLILILVTIVSLKATHKRDREANGFSWAPLIEVAKLFAGIFVAIIPVIAMLKAGRNGAFAPLVALVSNADGSANNAAYFWMTGVLSSFLDNAPTYIVFFELAGGDPGQLMTGGAATLAAISAGAVFMGANTYIGNAPNFMVYAIARQGGVSMPGFFGYMLWSGAILLPCFALATLIFFR